ncbi:hypothetical protein ILYODFUR_004054 [Ilyodon furcidens]|uniref:Uncharacterized protein n=1 Tax=Ilyodon furcidens TaxID=33524 RepID=A0ABV0UNV0_9TELE
MRENVILSVTLWAEETCSRGTVLAQSSLSGTNCDSYKVAALQPGLPRVAQQLKIIGDVSMDRLLVSRVMDELCSFINVSSPGMDKPRGNFITSLRASHFLTNLLSRRHASVDESNQEKGVVALFQQVLQQVGEGQCVVTLCFIESKKSKNSILSYSVGTGLSKIAFCYDKQDLISRVQGEVHTGLQAAEYIDAKRDGSKGAERSANWI